MGPLLLLLTQRLLYYLKNAAVREKIRRKIKFIFVGLFLTNFAEFIFANKPYLLTFAELNFAD